MQTAGSGPGSSSTAIFATLPVTASGHPGNLGLGFIVERPNGEYRVMVMPVCTVPSVFIANPVLALKECCLAVDVVENVELEALQVGKVDASQPVVGAIDHLNFFFIPDDRVPTV